MGLCAGLYNYYQTLAFLKAHLESRSRGNVQKLPQSLEREHQHWAKVTDFYSIDEQLGEVSRLHLGGLFV